MSSLNVDLEGQRFDIRTVDIASVAGQVQRRCETIIRALRVARCVAGTKSLCLLRTWV